MNILIVNTTERTGGAAVAANRLMHALNKAGYEVKMLVRDKQTDDPNVVSINPSRIKQIINFIRFAWERWVIFVYNRFSRKNLFRVSIANTGVNVSKHPLVKKADIVHLHWINQGFLSLADVKKIVQSGKPIVWTMHDMWTSTGICHYPGNCINYLSTCRKCPLVRRNIFRDIAYLTQKNKKCIGLYKVTFVGCSQWIVDMAKKSSLLSNATFISIPNPIDTNEFKQIRKSSDSEPPVLLFAAAKLADERKGVKFFVEACEVMKDKGVEVVVALMGNCEDEMEKLFPFKVHKLGFVNDTEELVKAYNEASLFVITSIEDNLPNTVMEAMACGVPCVGFNVGGIPEMIEHKVNGYVAQYQDVSDLANGIQWCLDPLNRDKLSQQALVKARKCYDEKVVAKQYIDLYTNLLK